MIAIANLISGADTVVDGTWNNIIIYLQYEAKGTFNPFTSLRVQKCQIMITCNSEPCLGRRIPASSFTAYINPFIILGNTANNQIVSACVWILIHAMSFRFTVRPNESLSTNVDICHSINMLSVLPDDSPLCVSGTWKPYFFPNSNS